MFADTAWAGLRGTVRCGTSYVTDASQCWDEFQATVREFRQLMSEALFAPQLSSNTRTRHPRSVLNAMLLFQFHRMRDDGVHFISGEYWEHTGGQRKSTGQTGCALSGHRYDSTTCCTAFIHWNSLCCFLCLSSGCRSVHWCHLVFKRLITWPEEHDKECVSVKIDEVINEVFHSGKVVRL